MKAHETFLTEARNLICDVAQSRGLELVDVEYQREPGGWVLRVLIDRQPGGVTIADCTEFSREIGDVLEVKDIVAFPYRLEISSPGVNRPLKSDQDFELHLGETVSVTTAEPLEGRKHFKGRLNSCRDGMLGLTIDGQDYGVPLAAVKKARLEYDFEKDRQPKKKH